MPKFCLFGFCYLTSSYIFPRATQTNQYSYANGTTNVLVFSPKTFLRRSIIIPSLAKSNLLLRTLVLFWTSIWNLNHRSRSSPRVSFSSTEHCKNQSSTVDSTDWEWALAPFPAENRDLGLRVLNSHSDCYRLLQTTPVRAGRHHLMKQTDRHHLQKTKDENLRPSTQMPSTKWICLEILSASQRYSFQQLRLKKSLWWVTKHFSC